MSHHWKRVALSQPYIFGNVAPLLLFSVDRSTHSAPRFSGRGHVVHCEGEEYKRMASHVLNPLRHRENQNKVEQNSSKNERIKKQYRKQTSNVYHHTL